MSRASFNRLEHKIEREYEAKGYSHARAERIGQATAGKTAHRKWAKRGRVPAEVSRQRSCVRAGLRGKHFGSRAAARRALAARARHCAQQERQRRTRSR